MSNRLGLKKQREQMLTALSGSPNDSWAAVELYRWQHGELPTPTGSKPLDIPAALTKMAEALVRLEGGNTPSPQNVASVLSYVAKLVKGGDTRSELKDLCREMLSIFDTVEDSEVSGKEFHPTTVQSCRVMDAQRIAEIFDRMRQLT